MKLSELASLTGARVGERFADVEIGGAAGLDEAGPGHVTFLANPRYTPRVQTTRAPVRRASSLSFMRRVIAQRKFEVQKFNAGGRGLRP